ncbi:MAG: hypothetical protein KBD53_10660, partial [Candidatus Omnitrophica bacterium]|nr:hypothetical protein [Candidatus Omnitrophota bacterium]
MTLKIAISGSTGLVGTAVSDYFKQKAEIIPIVRSHQSSAQAGQSISMDIQNQTIDLSTHKIYTVAGKNESPTITTEINLIQDKLLNKNLPLNRSLIKIDADGTHSEAYWKREFGAAYLWLFSDENLSIPNFQKKRLNVIGNSNTIWAEGLDNENEVFTIYDLSGKILESIVLKNGKNDLKNNYSEGIYILK